MIKKRKHLTIISLVILLLVILAFSLFQKYRADTVTLVARPPFAPGGTGQVWGQITDQNNQPQAKVSVIVGNRVAVTDTLGNYRIDSIEPGGYRLSFVKNGLVYYPSDAGSSATISVYEGATAATNVSISPEVKMGDDSLVLSLLFDETTGGQVADASPYANVTEAVKDVTIGAGKSGKARVFNGTSSYISFPSTDNLNPTTGLTLAAWVKIDQSYGWSVPARLIDKIAESGETGGYALKLKPAERGVSSGIEFDIIATFPWGRQKETCLINSADTPNNGSWFHLVAIWDGFVMREYVNGSEKCSTRADSDSGIIKTTSKPLNLGRQSDTNSEFFKGSLDDVKIFNRALSSWEIGLLRQ